MRRRPAGIRAAARAALLLPLLSLATVPMPASAAEARGPVTPARGAPAAGAPAAAPAAGQSSEAAPRATGKADWPSASIRLLYAADPDTPAGILARLLSHRMVEALGQQVYAESRPGEGGRLAVEATASAAPDGLTWLALDEGHPLSALRAGRAFDLSKSLLPVTQVAARGGPLLVAHPSLPVRTIGELQALALQKGRSLELASGDPDPSIALAAAALRAALGPALQPRMLPAAEAALADVLAGRSLLGFVDAREADAALRGSKLRALAVAGPSRLGPWPALLTLVESKLPDLDVAGWHGLWLPSGSPAAVASALQVEIARALQRPGMEARLAELGYRPVASTPTAFAAFVDAESVRLRALAARAGWPER